MENKGITLISILIIIAIIAGVGVLGYLGYQQWFAQKQLAAEDYTTQSACEKAGYYWHESACYERDQDASTGESISVPEKGEIHSIIDTLVPEDFSKEEAKYFVNDLNNDKFPEIIITTIQPKSKTDYFISQKGYFTVVSVTSEEGDYKQKGEMKYEANYYNIPEVKYCQDIDNDGVKEIFVDLGYGKISVKEGILDSNLSEQRLEFIKYELESGERRSAIFFTSGTAMHLIKFEIVDVDNDNKKEITTVHGRYKQEKPGQLKAIEAIKTTDLYEDKWLVCEAHSYEWDGSTFSFSRKLSKSYLSELGEDCQRR